jgi:hypothetical protein
MRVALGRHAHKIIAGVTKVYGSQKKTVRVEAARRGNTQTGPRKYFLGPVWVMSHPGVWRAGRLMLAGNSSHRRLNAARSR